MKQIVAVIVLYRRSAEESQAFCSLRQALLETTSVADAFEIVLCDNSPTYQTAPPGFENHYQRREDNPGLAPHYNFGLAFAADRQIPWLLLLDQDTTITAAYVYELLFLVNSRSGQNLDVIAFIPKLEDEGRIVSPRYPPGLRTVRTIDANYYGLMPDKLHVFNSGAVIRVGALREAGSFSMDFPMEYLDHVTFHALQARGGKLFIMRSHLAHQLAGYKPGRNDSTQFSKRIPKILEAEARFYRKYGTFLQRARLKLQYLRSAGAAARSGQFRQLTMYLNMACQC